MLFWDGWHIYFMYLFIYLLCIAHPFCVCVAMIEWFVFPEEMIWQVGQEMPRLRARDIWEFLYICYLFWFWDNTVTLWEPFEFYFGLIIRTLAHIQ